MKSTEMAGVIVMLCAIVALAATAVDPMVTMVVTLAFVFWCAVAGAVFAWWESKHPIQ